MMESDTRIIARIRELEEMRTERIIEAGYAVLVKLPNKESEELRAVFQALWTRTFYKDQAESK
jgi:hypothetical protein